MIPKFSLAEKLILEAAIKVLHDKASTITGPFEEMPDDLMDFYCSLEVIGCDLQELLIAPELQNYAEMEVGGELIMLPEGIPF